MSQKLCPTTLQTHSSKSKTPHSMANSHLNCGVKPKLTNLALKHQAQKSLVGIFYPGPTLPFMQVPSRGRRRFLSQMPAGQTRTIGTREAYEGDSFFFEYIQNPGSDEPHWFLYYESSYKDVSSSVEINGDDWDYSELLNTFKAPCELKCGVLYRYSVSGSETCAVDGNTITYGQQLSLVCAHCVCPQRNNHYCFDTGNAEIDYRVVVVESLTSEARETERLACTEEAGIGDPAVVFNNDQLYDPLDYCEEVANAGEDRCDFNPI